MARNDRIMSMDSNIFDSISASLSVILLPLEISKLEKKPKTGSWKFEPPDVNTGRVIPPQEAIERIDKRRTQKRTRESKGFGLFTTNQVIKKEEE